MEHKNCNKDKYLNNFTVFDHITDEKKRYNTFHIKLTSNFNSLLMIYRLSRTFSLQSAN